MILHHLLSTQTLTLLHPIPDDEQLLFLQSEHLQITGSLNFLLQHLADLKAMRKYPSHFYQIPAQPVKTRLGLRKFLNGQEPHIFGAFKRKMMMARRFHVWNMATEIYETKIEVIKEKKIYERWCGNEETYYNAAGIEFFTFTSVIH